MSSIPSSVRWSIAALVVVIALIVAIWPRDEGTDSGLSAGPPSAVDGAPTPIDAGALAAARTRAALAPCPSATAAPPATAALRGVSAPCLGFPGTVDLGAALAGTPTLINFWAPWCLPCRRELPTIAAYAARAGTDVRVLAVQAREGSENPVLALDMLSDLGVRLPSVVDTESRIAAALQAPRAYPVSILLRADGSVAKVLPTVFSDEQAVSNAVSTYLGVAR
ncbi:TlpA family protein disulfide reductase [Williamsia sp. CHRR-6]|nr:TlpA family protein disulfide reductase [Williamsia sp. CHRR-6]